MKKRTRVLSMIMAVAMILSCFSGMTVSAVNATGDDVDHNGWTAVSQSGGDGTTAISACGFTSGGHWYFYQDGKYYLTEDITLDKTVYVYPGDEMSLDLNGYNLSNNAGDSTVLNIKSNATLNLYGTGTDLTYWKISDTDHVAEIIENPSTESDYDFTTTGGAIINGTANAMGGGGVFIQSGGTLNMYGGNIVGNQCASGDDRQGGGIYNHEGTVNMYGGSIQGNASNKTTAGGVYNRANSTFNLYGGTIAYNYTATYGAGVYNAGTFNIYDGGIISNNTANNGGGGISTIGIVNMEGGSITENVGGGRCGGVFIAANGTLNMSGGSITENHSGANGEGGVGIIYATSTFNMTGGSITGNTTTGVSAGVGFSAGTFTLSGEAVITANYVVDGYGDEIKQSNAYLYNDQIVFTDDFSGDVGVTAGTGTGTVAYGDDFTVGTDGNLTSDNSAYYLVKVDGNVELQAERDVECADTLTYSGEVNLTKYFSYENGDTSYSLIGGTGTGTLSGYTLDPTVAGTFIIKAVTPYSEYNAPTTETLTLTINPKTVTISGITAVGTVVNDKVELDNTSGKISGTVTGDDVSIDFTVAYGSFTDNDYDGDEGTYAVTVHDIALSGADAGVYEITAVDDTEVEIKIATPYIAWPTAKDITYGDERSDDDLIGGQVMVKYGESWTDITQYGEFVWVTEENPSAGTHTYEVEFVLDTENANYSTYNEYTDELKAVTHNVTQLVNMAEVEFTITGNVGTDSNSLSITAKDAAGNRVSDSNYQIYYTDGDGDWSFAQGQSAPTEVGSYLIAADFTAVGAIENPNYVHAGTMESYAKQIGGLVICTDDNDEPTTYSVTFTGYSNYNITGALSEDIHILPTVEEGYAWGTTIDGDDVIYQFGARFPQPAYDVTFTLVSITDTGTISGTITGTNIKGTEDANLEGVTVALVQGPDQVAIMETGTDGTYKFEDMPYGRYDLVVTRDYVIRNEETVYVELDSSTATVNVTIPDTRQNTIFNVAAGMTAITVEGMKELITGTTTRSIKLELETATTAETTNILTAAAADALTTDNCKLFFDISIQERADDAVSYSETDLASTEFLTLYIPLAGIYQGYDNYIVYQDDGTVAKMSSDSSSGGEYATVDGNLLTLHIRKSGIYGLGFYDDPASTTVDAVLKTTTYTGETIDTNSFFTTIGTEVTATYVITGGNGVGTIDSSGMLTVTEVGTFEITVTVAVTADAKTYVYTGTLEVKPATVTISAITCVDRGVDDGSTAVTINQGALLTGVAAGDDVQIDYSKYEANINDEDFAQGTTLTTTGTETFDVTVSGLDITGNQAKNYTLVFGNETETVASTVDVTMSLVYIAWPAALDIVYGTERSNDDLYGGKVMVYEYDSETGEGTYTDITDSGTFQWVDKSSYGSTYDNAGTYQYEVVFVENDTLEGYDGEASYCTALANTTQLITQVVQPAAVTFTIDDSTLKYGEDELSITVSVENDDTLEEVTDYILYYTDKNGDWDWDKSEGTPTDVGTYLVGAELVSANYRHAGTQVISAKQIGAFTIYTGTEPTTYTTTFIVDGSACETYDGSLKDNILVLPTLDTDDYTGWLYEDGTTYAFEDRFTQPGANVTFTAIEAPEKIYSVSGTITGTDLNGIEETGLSRVGVALYQGSNLIAHDETDEKGEYSFDVAPDIYNLVITRDLGEACTITVYIDATEGSVTGQDYTLPDVVQNSIYNVQSGMPDMVVQGLNSLTVANTDDGTVDSETLLEVTSHTGETSDEEVAAILAEAAEAGLDATSVKLYMNIDLYSKVGYESQYSAVTELDGNLVFYIPLTGMFQGHDEYIVYRYHDGQVHTLTEEENELGEYIKVSEDKTTLEIHAKLYSLYAIAFANETPSTSSSTTTYYTATTSVGENGSISSISPSRAAKGTTVTVTVTPDDGCEVDVVTVTTASGSAVTVTDNGDGTYSFTQPSSAVTVSVTFTAVDAEDTETSGLPFVDVSVDDWFYEDVLYLYELGLMTGTSDTTFEPYGGNSRAMVAQIMYNLEGQPERTEFDFFSDVTVGDWYEEAVNWCATNGVVDGYPDGLYRPEQIISRQEFANVLYDHCLYLGYDMSALNDLSAFADAPSTWAETYMMWAVEAGIFQGDDNGYLNCSNQLTRCEAAAVIARFLRNVYQED